MRRRIDIVLLAALPPLLLLFVLGVNCYPPGIGNSHAQDVFLAATLATVTYVLAAAVSIRLLRNESLLRRSLVFASCLFVAFVLIFVILIASLTEVPAGTSRRIPVGLAYSKNFLDILPSNSDNVTVTKEEFGYDLGRIYRPWSVIASIFLFVGCWMILFASLGVIPVAFHRLRRLGGVEISVQQAGDVLTSKSTTRSGLERTIKDRIPQINMAVWRERTTAVEGQVCRVEIDGNPAGTGFLVGPDVVITNYHVVETLLDGSVATSSVTVRFDYKVLANNTRSPGVVAGLHPTGWRLDFSPYAEGEKRGGGRELPTLEELDYALLRLDVSLGLKEFTPGDSLKPRRRGWLSLPDLLPELLIKSPLVIVQHPDGAPLKLAIDTEAFLGLNTNQTRMQYTTNTEPGSSGSPVFDFEWNLVALHHLGDPAVNKLRAEFNQGIPINAIRRRITDTSRRNSHERTSAISHTT